MPDGKDRPDQARLDSWKEIASYLGREVRTVQLWEKNEGLPIHRHQHSRQGSVYAFRQELDGWRSARASAPPVLSGAPDSVPEPPPQKTESAPQRRPWYQPAALILPTLVSGALLIGTLAFWEKRSPELPTAVAVLPFLDLSPQKDSEYFSDGLSEEIIDALSRVPDLHVVARTSSFAFKGRNSDIREIGRQLNVNGVIEGSVRKSGESLRITAQLNRVTDGYHLWSHTWDRQMRDGFTVQREISEAIAAELRAGRSMPPRRQLTSNMDAYRLYQEGRYLFNKFEYPESNYKAIERYRQAIALDSNFSAAWAGIADAYSYLAENLVSPPREVMPKAKEAAEKALALDDGSAEAHTSLGIVKLDYERDVPAAQREFLRALQLNSGLGWARHWYAHTLEDQNRVADAHREMQAALNLDPLSVPMNWDIAGELVLLGRYDEALRHLAKAKELFPSVYLFDYMRVMVNWRKGDNAAAREMLASLRMKAELANDPSFIAVFAAAQAREGHAGEARALVARLEDMRKSQYVEPFLLMDVSKALHDRAQLMVWLRRADEERSTFFVSLHSYAAFWGLDKNDIAEFEKSTGQP